MAPKKICRVSRCRQDPALSLRDNAPLNDACKVTTVLATGPIAALVLSSGGNEKPVAPQELYPAERAQVQTQVGELVATVQLYRALGGGWQSAPPSTNAPSAGP